MIQFYQSSQAFDKNPRDTKAMSDKTNKLPKQCKPNVESLGGLIKKSVFVLPILVGHIPFLISLDDMKPSSPETSLFHLRKSFKCSSPVAAMMVDICRMAHIMVIIASNGVKLDFNLFGPI